MLRLLADENFNGNVLRALLHECPTIDVIRVQDVGLDGADDADILQWAADNERIVLTHDRATMPDFAYERIAAGDRMLGLFVLDIHIGVRPAVDALSLVESCSNPAEWDARVVFLPL